MFKNFKNMVEKETGNNKCYLCTDQGGEFTSIEFNSYCHANGIKRQLTAAFSPQQRWSYGRKNRTVMNMVRCMLLTKKFLRSFGQKM